MATILAANTGNWSATSTWTGGVVPVAGDIVVANNKTITVNQNVTVAELRNDTTGGATVGGQFQLTNGVVVNANVIQGATSTSCVSWAGSAGQTVTLTGAFTGGSASGASAVSVTTAGSMVCQSGSTATGGTGNAAHGISWSSTGALTFTGTAAGGNTGGNNHGINFNGSGSSLTFNGTISGGGSNGGNGVSVAGNTQSFNITATITGSTATAFVSNSSTTTGTITGTCTGGTGSGSYGVSLANSFTCSITGDCYSGSGANSYGIYHSGAGTLTLIGNIFGHGTQANTTGFALVSSGTANVIGSATGGNAGPGATNNNTGILRVIRAVGNGYGQGSVGMSSAVGVSSSVQGALTYVEQIQFGSLGQTPVSGPIRLTALTTNQAIFITTTGTTKTLVDTAATSGVLPAATDVRTGVVYSSGNLTGTCAVPAAGSVALGVPVGNTTGTAVLTAADARTALGLANANLDTQLSGISTSVSALPSAATIASTVWNTLTSGLSTASSIGKLLVDNVNATISSRLASASYSAAPSAADVRTELDANSTKLANLDATVSSRSTYAGGDTSGTTTLLSRLTALRAGYLDNISTAPPTASAVATAVWAAASRTLTTAIDNSATIAAAVWSYATGRTITGGTVDTLTNAPMVPSPAAIASQVRTELTTELGRIDASVSSRLAASSYTTPPTAGAITSAVWAAADKTGYTLTSAERTAIATAVEQSILNESDGQQVLNAIVGAIGNTNVDQVALVAAIRADLERAGGTLATRLATASYTTPPTAAANATAVRTELATELGRIDTTVSSRLAPSGTLSRVTLTDTTTTLTNAPNVPSASTIASQVRTELTPELARMANAATVDTTGQQIQDAVTN